MLAKQVSRRYLSLGFLAHGRVVVVGLVGVHAFVGTLNTIVVAVVVRLVLVFGPTAATCTTMHPLPCISRRYLVSLLRPGRDGRVL